MTHSPTKKHTRKAGQFSVKTPGQISLKINSLVLTPDAAAPDGLAAALRGDLAVILSLALAPEGTRGPLPGEGSTFPGAAMSGSLLSVVAGTGFEPVTFRL